MTAPEHTDAAGAVSAALENGGCVYLAGFSHLVPFATGHEIARQEFTDLDIVRLVPDLLCDQLVAGGCVSKLTFSWAGNPGVGMLRAVRRAVEEGIPHPIEVEEYTHFGLSTRLAAAAKGYPFLPLRTFTGSDLPAYTDAIERIEDPFGTGETFVVPPLSPDVALVHAQRADSRGNAHAWGLTGDVVDAVFAAETVVLSVEEVVPEKVIQADPNRTIPGTEIDYLVEEPFGAYPSYAQGYYDRNDRAYEEWDDHSQSHESTHEWLDEWVYGMDTRSEYLAALDEAPAVPTPKPTGAEPIEMGVYR